jgi:antitoxin component of MazEF toxin-antitoxin module
MAKDFSKENIVGSQGVKPTEACFEHWSDGIAKRHPVECTIIELEPRKRLFSSAKGRVPTRANSAAKLDYISKCRYNVITMKTSIITIGNSKGVRIPKPLLEESGLSGTVELKAVKGKISIVAGEPAKKVSETMLLSEKVLARDWLRPEEDEAWASLQ